MNNKQPGNKEAEAEKLLNELYDSIESFDDIYKNEHNVGLFEMLNDNKYGKKAEKISNVNIQEDSNILLQGAKNKDKNRPVPDYANMLPSFGGGAKNTLKNKISGINRKGPSRADYLGIRYWIAYFYLKLHFGGDEDISSVASEPSKFLRKYVKNEKDWFSKNNKNNKNFQKKTSENMKDGIKKVIAAVTKKYTNNERESINEDDVLEILGFPKVSKKNDQQQYLEKYLENIVASAINFQTIELTDYYINGFLPGEPVRAKPQSASAAAANNNNVDPNLKLVGYAIKIMKLCKELIEIVEAGRIMPGSVGFNACRTITERSSSVFSRTSNKFNEEFMKIYRKAKEDYGKVNEVERGKIIATFNTKFRDIRNILVKSVGLKSKPRSISNKAKRQVQVIQEKPNKAGEIEKKDEETVREPAVPAARGGGKPKPKSKKTKSKKPKTKTKSKKAKSTKSKKSTKSTKSKKPKTAKSKKKTVTHDGRKYTVRTGERGGKYILKKGKKVYL